MAGAGDDLLGLGGEDEPIDVVATVGALDPVVVLLREFLHRSGAVRAVGVVDMAPGEGPALVDCGRLLPTEVSAGGRTVHLPHAVELDAEIPPVPDVRQLPAFDVDRATGEVSSPLGGLEHYAIAVRELAQRLGPGSVALVTFETTDPDAPLSITARGEDPLVLAIGEDEYEMEPGWPRDTRARSL